MGALPPARGSTPAPYLECLIKTGIYELHCASAGPTAAGMTRPTIAA